MAPDDCADAARDLEGATYVEAPTLVLPPDCKSPPLVLDEEDLFEAKGGPVADVAATARAPATMVKASSPDAEGPELMPQGTDSGRESAQPGSWLGNLRHCIGKYIAEFQDRLSESALPKDDAGATSGAQKASLDPMSGYAEDFRAKWHARRADYRRHRHVAMAGRGGKDTSSYWLRQHILA
jgi:hypothetical protein